MQHIPEHTLELYVLDSGTVAGERAEIEAHLAVCHGCRAAEAAMRSFYEEAGRALEEVKSAGDPAGEALVRAERALRPLFTEVGPVERPLRAVTPLGRMQIFIRRHPVMAGSGALASLAAALLGLSMLRPPSPEPPNPARVLPNFQTGRLEVYDARDTLLWTLPSQELSATRAMEDWSYRELILKRSHVVDLDSDGRGELITTLMLYNETRAESLRVFSPEKNPLWAAGFDRTAPHRVRVYKEKRFLAGTFVVLPSRAGRPSIFVVASMTNSPTCLVHLDENGREVGSWWHHGQFQVLATDADRDGTRDIVAYGINDMNEGLNTEHPFFAVLAADRILGISQSTATALYTVPLSTAEKYYVGLPLTDINLAQHTNASAHSFLQESDSLFSVSSVTGPEMVPGFRFWFNHRMEVLQVKTGNPTELLHAQLRREGKLRSTMGTEYLESLRREVRYWDGTGWSAAPARVSIPTQVASGAPR